MTRRIFQEMSRRELLARVSRYSAAGVVASIAGLGSGCGNDTRQQVPGGLSGAGVPRLPEGSPDFDLINTVLQLEHRAASLASETRQGRRLGGRAAGAVDRIIDDHRAHIAALEQLVRGAGATPDPPRYRYSLPTPLGDERRALGILLEDENNLVSMYSRALVQVQSLGLARPLGSLLFSSKTHGAVLERLLDRCTEPVLRFGDSEGSGLPVMTQSVAVVPPGPILQGLSRVETSVGRMCGVAAAKIEARYRALELRASSRALGGATPAPTIGTERLEVSGYCLLLRDREGRTVGSAVADIPTAVSMLQDDSDANPHSRTVVSSVVSLLMAMSSAHGERAAFWESAAESAGESGDSANTSGAPQVASRLPDELSPTAVGIPEDRLEQGDSTEEIRPADVFSAVQEAEAKTAEALCVAASNLASEALRLYVAGALTAVATATSRLVGLATGDDYLVPEV